MNLVNGATDKTVLDRFMKLDISDCGRVIIFLFYTITIIILYLNLHLMYSDMVYNFILMIDFMHTLQRKNKV